MKRQLACVLAFLVLPLVALGQSARIDPAGIKGSLLMCGSYKPSPEALEKFVELAGGAKAKIVFVECKPTVGGGPPIAAINEILGKLEAKEAKVVDYSQVAEAVKDATGVWLHVDSVSSWGKALKAQSIRNDCKAVMNRGGVIATAAAGMRYLGVQELAINGSPCLTLLPDSLIEPRGKSSFAPLVRSTSRWRGLVGYEIHPEATLLVKGRTLSAVGPGLVNIYLNPKEPPRALVSKRNGKDDPRSDVQDLTALRRAVFDRANSFPPREVEAPLVPKGTLVIVGGGGSPEGLYKRFIEYAGGEGKANIVIFPTANPDPLPKRDFVAAAFQKAGARTATVLYGRTQTEVESKEFLDTLKEATGLWFDGGRQWRFVDCYENTKALPLMFDVLERGGVIGGTSAGATIQGEYLARGGVFNNFDIRYEGYERGLGFLKGVAIDQHFTQRKRQADMTQLMKVYPQYLGIGIDEATAIVVKKSEAEVIGKGKVHFYDMNRKFEKGQPDYEALPAGGRYDLKERKILGEAK